MHGRGRDAHFPADLHRTEPAPPPRFTIRLTTSGGVFAGIERGWLDRSSIGIRADDLDGRGWTVDVDRSAVRSRG